jgi:hypothetical protein
MLVDGLSNGTLEILWIIHGYRPWAIQKLVGSLELEVLMCHAMFLYMHKYIARLWLIIHR